MNWIEKIIEVRNYTIKALWNDGLEREINLIDFLNKKAKITNSSYNKILDLDEFSKVKCDGTTLYWENMIEYKDIDGSVHIGNLDISPELLYDISTKVSKSDRTANKRKNLVAT